MRIKAHDIFIVSLMLIVGTLSWYTNYQRTKFGFFTSANWIFFDGLMYTILSGLIAGYVIVKILNSRRKK